MQIWIDADACPAAIREILYRAASRVRIQLILVANSLLRTPPSPYISSMRAEAGYNAADRKILEKMKPGDLVITADIPLAAEVISQKGYALNPRGQFYSSDTIKERLTMRNFMDELRDIGVNTGGPPPMGRKERQAFANQLDRFLVQHTGKSRRP